ncbi:hypothetical protein M0R04_12340 [Candidatus Dojkabacteria bacterium]|nr:hypothetical protein [Candidatus Dojkabacteria bacterium]
MAFHVNEYCLRCNCSQDFIVTDNTETPFGKTNSIVEAMCPHCKKTRNIYLTRYYFIEYHKYLAKQGELP